MVTKSTASGVEELKLGARRRRRVREWVLPSSCVQLNFSTTATLRTEKNGCCGEVAVMMR